MVVFFVVFFLDSIGCKGFLLLFIVRRSAERVITLCLLYLNAMPRPPNTHTHTVTVTTR